MNDLLIFFLIMYWFQIFFVIVDLLTGPKYVLKTKKSFLTFALPFGFLLLLYLKIISHFKQLN